MAGASPGVFAAATNHEKRLAALKTDRSATEIGVMTWMPTGASANAERPRHPAAESEWDEALLG